MKGMLTGIISGVFLLLCLYLIYFGAGFWKFRKVVAKWPSVRGKLIKAHLDSPKLGADAPSDKVIKVHYTYVANGKTWEGAHYYASELRGMEKSGMESELQTVVNGIDQEPLVYFNPQAPEKSFLQHDNWSGPIFILVLGILGAIISFGMLLSVIF